MTQLVVVEPGYQIEPQPKTAAAVSIPLRDDTKDFQMTYHVFHHNPEPRQQTILAFVFIR
jgi:hypothetical protein